MDLLYTDSENRLKSIVDSAPFPIGVYVGHELKIDLANPAMMQAWGKGNDVVGKLYTEILPELYNQEIFEQLRGVLATGVPFHAKNQRVDLVINGVLKPYYFNYSFTPLYDAYNKVYGVMNTAADVTDLNVARQKYQESEEKLRLAIESADLGMYEANLLTDEINTSDRFNTIWGITPPVTKTQVSEYIHPDDREIRLSAHKDAIENGGNLSYEARVVHKDNSIHWVRIKGKMVFNQEREPVSILGIVQDISDQKQFAEELTTLVEKSTTELHRSNQDLLQFAHVVSHDLKEPVRKISIFNSAIKNEFGDKVSDKANTYLDKVQKATNRMYGMIDGILTYSKLNSSEQFVEKIDLNDIIANIQSDLEVVIETKQATITKEALPVLEGAPILINQLFYNLLNNALKFSRANVSPKINISYTIVAAEKNDYAHITVSDNGIGIDPQYSKHIFNTFAMLNSKDAYEGTGLGLALCKKIVERHHGSIEAVSKEIGTDFIVCLPLEQWDKNI